MVKNPLAPQERQFDPWAGKIPWRRKWQCTPVFLPGKSHGQRSLAGYSPWGHKDWDVTEATENSRWLCYSLTVPQGCYWLPSLGHSSLLAAKRKDQMTEL